MYNNNDDFFSLQIRNSDESQAINFLTEVTGIGWVQIPHVHVCVELHDFTVV